MWPAYLAAGLAVSVVLIAALPLIAIWGLSSMVNLFAKGEVDDEES